jgi:hypothetical protein
MCVIGTLWLPFARSCWISPVPPRQRSGGDHAGSGKKRLQDVNGSDAEAAMT